MAMNFPEIDFVETNAEAIETELVNMYEEIMGRTVYPASPERLFIAWLTQIIVQQRVIINDSAKRNVPRYARGEYLESLGELFGMDGKLEAAPATTTFRFYITEPQEVNIEIPAGTRVTPDGELMFETTKSTTVKAGEKYADAPGQCQTPGEIGNDYEAGQISTIIDAYDFNDYAENLEKTSGGSDEESDEEYYNRMRNSAKGYSTAGPEESYIYHALSASSAIMDTTANSPSPGVVDIRVLLKNNETPTEALLEDIQKKLSASEIRPLTDYVTVSTPDSKEYEIDVSYWITEPPNTISEVDIKQKVTAAVNEFVEWQAGKIGRDINPARLSWCIMQQDTNIKRTVIRKPENIVLSQTEAAKCTKINLVYEGIENE